MANLHYMEKATAMITQAELQMNFIIIMVLAYGSLIGMAIYSVRLTRKKRAACVKTLDTAISRGVLEDSDFDQLLALHQIPEAQAAQVLRSLLAQYLTSDSKDVGRARQLITVYNEHKPYAELPDDIRIQLSQIAEHCPGQKSAVGHLAHSLTDIYRKRTLELQKERRLSKLSFAFGALGLVFSVVQFFPSLTHKAEANSPGTAAQQRDRQQMP